MVGEKSLELDDPLGVCAYVCVVVVVVVEVLAGVDVGVAAVTDLKGVEMTMLGSSRNV